jgi:glutathione S-transferase
MLRVYGYEGSINVRKVLWACVELDLDFEREDWGTRERPTSHPDFRSLSSVGLVLVVRDGKTVVWESNVIIRYLAASRARHDLLPTDAARRARVEMWMDWQASDFNNSWRILQGLVRKNPAHQDPSAIASSVPPVVGWTTSCCILRNSAPRIGLVVCVHVGFRRYGSITMASLSIAGAGHADFGSQITLLFSRITSSVAANVAAARKSAEARRRFAELSRMSPEQLARLELTNSHLMAIVLAAVI